MRAKEDERLDREGGGGVRFEVNDLERLVVLSRSVQYYRGLVFAIAVDDRPVGDFLSDGRSAGTKQHGGVAYRWYEKPGGLPLFGASGTLSYNFLAKAAPKTYLVSWIEEALTDALDHLDRAEPARPDAALMLVLEEIGHMDYFQAAAGDGRQTTLDVYFPPDADAAGQGVTFTSPMAYRGILVFGEAENAERSAAAIRSVAGASGQVEVSRDGGVVRVRRSFAPAAFESCVRDGRLKSLLKGAG
jgi:hypothetical protein